MIRIRSQFFAAALTCLLACSAALLGQPRSAPRAAESTPQIEEAMQMLAEGDWLLQWQAMQVLAEAKAVQALDPLRRLVNDQRANPWLRGRALVAVAQIRDSAALGPALAMARSDDTALRAAAIEALGILGSARGKDLVLDALKDGVPDEVRYKAVEAYARIHGEPAMRFIEAGIASDDPQMVRHAVRGLSHVDTPEANRKLVELIDSEREEAATAAANAARRRALPEAIGALLRRASATQGSDTARDAARGALASYPPTVLSAPLAKAFREDDDAVRRIVLELLKTHPAPQAVDEIAKVVEGGGLSENVMVEALSLFGAGDPGRYREVFQASLSHQSPRVRQAAVTQLAMTDADLFTVLRPLLTDPETVVRAQVLEELAASDQPTPPEGIVAYLEPMLALATEEEAGALLTLVGNRIRPTDAAAAMPALNRFLTIEKHRAAAAEVLGRVGDQAMQRQVAAAQGYIARWRVVGSFVRSDPKAAIDEVLPPESATAFEGTYQDDDDKLSWRAMDQVSVDGRANPGESTGIRPLRGVIYLGAVLRVDDVTPVAIAFDSGSAGKVFLNGQVIITHADRDETQAAVQLQPGANRLLVKLAGDAWQWPFRIRLTDPQGALLQGVRIDEP